MTAITCSRGFPQRSPLPEIEWKEARFDTAEDLSLEREFRLKSVRQFGSKCQRARTDGGRLTQKCREWLPRASSALAEKGAQPLGDGDGAGLSPAQRPATSSSLKSGEADITQKLKELRGKEFDKFYIDNEVTYHKNVTDAVDAVLIPSAQNGELKAALQGAQPLFLKHLEHARSVQSGTGESMSH